MARVTLAGAITNSYSSKNGGIDVNIQSQTEPLFQYLLMNNINTGITLTAQVEIEDETINVSAGHGFTGVAGEYIVLQYKDTFIQQRVTGVATNTISIEMPIDNAFPIVGTTVIRGSVNMNIDGSSIPQTFDLTLNALSGATIPIDVSSIVITMQHGADVPDDGRFGGIAALVNGMYFRKINGSIFNLGNYRTNQGFKAIGARVEYTQKAPAGTYGTNIFIDLEEIFGQVIRLNPRSNDALVAIIRDNLAILAGMTISIIGSLTTGE